MLSFLILYQCLWHFILRHVSLFMIGRAICIDPHVCTWQSYHEFLPPPPPPRERERERGREGGSKKEGKDGETGEGREGQWLGEGVRAGSSKCPLLFLFLLTTC